MKSHDRILKGLNAIFGIDFSQCEKVTIKAGIGYTDVVITTYPQTERYPTFKSHDVAVNLLALAGEQLDRNITNIEFSLSANDFPRVIVERLIADKV